MKGVWQNLKRACGQKRLPVAVLSFLAGAIYGSLVSYEKGARDQARMDALTTPEGREHIEHEVDEFERTNYPRVWRLKKHD